MEKTMVAYEQLEELLDDKYYLVYIDYRDDLSNRLEEVQKWIHGEDMDDPDWLFEAQWDGKDCAMEDLKKAIMRTFEMDEAEAEELIEDNRQDLEDEIYSRDESDPMHDLCRNTRDQVFFYDLGVFIECDGFPLSESIGQVRRALKIRKGEYQKELEELCANAYYGGNLVVFFNSGVEEWFHWKTEGKNRITFKDPHICIYDMSGGSGHDVWLKGFTISRPWNRENLFLDKTIKYSYTYSICGMSSDWCDGTSVTLEKVEKIRKAERSRVNNHLDREARYNETYRKGGCTFGDMDIRRHRRTPYINEFPCGNKCLDCGTFWID